MYTHDMHNTAPLYETLTVGVVAVLMVVNIIGRHIMEVIGLWDSNNRHTIAIDLWNTLAGSSCGDRGR